MAKQEIGNWYSSRQKEADSVNLIIYLLTGNFPFDGYDETERFSKDDITGIDLRFFPNQEFSDLTGLPIINVQVKSSETGFEHFLKNGKMKYGKDGQAWKDLHLVSLDAGWHPQTIIADFVSQVGNLMGVYETPQMDDFVSHLKPYVQQCYHRVESQGLLTLFNRKSMYDWVTARQALDTFRVA